MIAPAPQSLDRIALRYLRSAALTAGVGVVAVCALLAAAPLPRAITADGAVSAESATLSISHGEGGLIVDIAAQPGDVVQAGDLLFRLAPAAGAGDTDTLRLRAARLALAKARLTALMEGTAPDFSTDQALDPVRARHEQRLYDIEKASLGRLTRVIDRRIADLRQDIAELEARLAQARTVATRHGVTRDAGFHMGSTPQTVLAADVTATRARIEAGQANQDLGLARAALSRAETQRAELLAERRRGWSSEMAEISSALSELDLRLVRQTTRITELEVRAPAGGRIQRVAALQEGEVATPGAALAEILPTDAQLQAEIYVDARAARQIEIGGAVRARVDGVDIPIEGLVRSVGDEIVHTADGRTFRRVLVALAPMALTDTGQQVALLPGMWVTAEIAINEASLLEEAARAIAAVAFGPAHANAP